LGFPTGWLFTTHKDHQSPAARSRTPPAARSCMPPATAVRLRWEGCGPRETKKRGERGRQRKDMDYGMIHQIMKVFFLQNVRRKIQTMEPLCILLLGRDIAQKNSIYGCRPRKFIKPRIWPSYKVSHLRKLESWRSVQCTWYNALGVHQMALGYPLASRACLRMPQLQQGSTRALVVAVQALPQATTHPCFLCKFEQRGTHLEETIESTHEMRWGWHYLSLAASFPVSLHRGRAGSSGGRRPGCGHCGV
jgi:hypothetical protein